MSYIDREWLIECFREWEENAKGGENTEGYVKAMSFARRFLESCRCPYGGDVVKVVRCKACKFARQLPEYVRQEVAPRYRMCAVDGKIRSADYFCAKGKPKEGAEL